MEDLAKITERDISAILDPTIAIFAPLLSNKKQEIKEIPFKTFKYGRTDRHQLDVYYPIKENVEGKTPIIFFIYGGGFTTGERNLSAKFGLVYACIGAFFARRGFLTVIADYRLVPHVRFPKPAEDIRDAVAWIVQNHEILISPGSPSPDINNLIIMGHSAGAVHAATVAFSPDVLPLTAELRRRITGLVLVAGGFNLSDAKPHTAQAVMLEQYWGSLDEAMDNDPISLFHRLPDSAIKALPNILMVMAEREPEWLAKVVEDMNQALSTRLNRPQKMIVAQGHNHISINWALSTGQGEKWAEEVAEWIASDVVGSN